MSPVPKDANLVRSDYDPMAVLPVSWGREEFEHLFAI